MGNSISKLIKLFDCAAPDPDIHSQLKGVVSDVELWSKAHRVRDVIRDRLLYSEDEIKLAYYAFAESCLESIYNETNPTDPFDTVSPFWVFPTAVKLAQLVNVSVESVLKVV